MVVSQDIELEVEIKITLEFNMTFDDIDDKIDYNNIQEILNIEDYLNNHHIFSIEINIHQN